MRSLSTLLKYILIVLFTTNLCVFCYAQKLARFEFTQYHMGNDIRIVLYAANSDIAIKAAASAFDRFAELDDIMSDYRANSELMKLCSKSGGAPVPVSKDLFDVLKKSQEFAELSNGAFDVTCSPIVRLWRTARKTKVLPKENEISAARALTGYKFLKLNEAHKTAQLMKLGMQLDLGGIGKGYGADQAQIVLKHLGIKSALIQAGGDIVVSNPPPGKEGWVVQVSNAATAAEGPDLTFANCAVSTSGDTEQFVEIDGKRYSHIVDPRTGIGLTDRIQVTIIAPNGTTSDGLTKIVSVLGPKIGIPLTQKYRGTKVYFRYATN